MKTSNKSISGLWTGVRVVNVGLDIDHVCRITGLTRDELTTILSRAPRYSTVFAWTRSSDGRFQLRVLEAGLRLLDGPKCEC